MELEMGENGSTTPGGSGARISAMCWSPEGFALAVAMADGVYHIIDGETGIVSLTIEGGLGYL